MNIFYTFLCIICISTFPTASYFLHSYFSLLSLRSNFLRTHENTSAYAILLVTFVEISIWERCNTQRIQTYTRMILFSRGYLKTFYNELTPYRRTLRITGNSATLNIQKTVARTESRFVNERREVSLLFRFVFRVDCSRDRPEGSWHDPRGMWNACGNWMELRQVRDPARRGGFSLIAERERERDEHVSFKRVFASSLARSDET